MENHVLTDTIKLQMTKTPCISTLVFKRISHRDTCNEL